MFHPEGLNQVDKGDVALQSYKCIFSLIKNSSIIISPLILGYSSKSRTCPDRLTIRGIYVL